MGCGPLADVYIIIYTFSLVAVEKMKKWILN